jgi:DNA-binding transcriptional LysR family regulator
MDKLQAMSVFVQIAERGSLTAAADALGKSLPAVVRILASLEASLQVRLFNRTTRRIALTEEGRFYLERCRRILGDIEDAELTLGQHETEPRGVITVTAPVRFGEMHVAPAVTHFLRRYRQLQVRLLLLDRVIDMLEEGVDVAVRIAPLADSSLIAKPIGAIRQVVCASPELLAETGQPQRPEDLSRLPCVRFTGISAASTWRFRENGRDLTVPVNASFNCNQVGPSVNACIAGLGFGMFYCYQVMPAVRRGELQLLLTEFEPDPLPLSLVFPQNRLLSPRVRSFVDWMAQALPASLELMGTEPF